jgi:hypothetical protein
VGDDAASAGRHLQREGGRLRRVAALERGEPGTERAGEAGGVGGFWQRAGGVVTEDVLVDELTVGGEDVDG